MATQRYTVTYLNRPAGQQVSAATLFFSDSDDAANTIYAAIVAQLTVDNTKALNTSIDGDYSSVGALGACKELRANVATDGGEVGYLHIPHCGAGVGQSDIDALLTLGYINDNNGNAFSKVLRYEEVNISSG